MSIVLNQPINLFAAIGLLLDFIGVLLLLNFGLPSKIIDKRGPSLIAEYNREQEKIIDEKNSRIKRGSNFGLTLVAAGFLIQLAGVFLKTT